MEDTATLFQLLGAFGFGMLLGWYLYYINRYRKEEVKLADLATVIAAIGGAAVLALFPAKSDLFGAYGIGLAVGFFGYFLVLLAFVIKTPNFSCDWFLDGRRSFPDGTIVIPHLGIFYKDARGFVLMPELDPGGGHGMKAKPGEGKSGEMQ